MGAVPPPDLIYLSGKQISLPAGVGVGHLPISQFQRLPEGVEISGEAIALPPR